MSGYCLLLFDVFFETELSFFFNLLSCIPSRYKSESITIFKVEVRKEGSKHTRCLEMQISLHVICNKLYM